MSNLLLNSRATLFSNGKNTKLRFHIDAPLDVQEISDNLCVEGWVVHYKEDIERVALLFEDGCVLDSTKPNIHRRRVHENFKKFYNSKSAGFELNISNPVAGKYLLVAETCKKQFTLAQISLQENLMPKLLFMHIAKTAGSSVNTYLASHYAKDRGSVHVESNEKWRKDRSWAQNLGFVSGHFNLAHFKRVLNPEGYYKITVVREPYAHLISHLAWIRKLADHTETGRFAQHPLYVQQFAVKLASVNLSKPKEIAHLITSLEDKEKQLVDNCQVRYFTQIPVGKDVSAKDAQSAIEASAEFDLIGTTDNINQFLKNVAEQMQWLPPKTEVRENVSGYYYGLTRSDADIRKALESLVRYDLKLYHFIKNLQELEKSAFSEPSS
jgi:hypothetical protein